MVNLFRVIYMKKYEIVQTREGIHLGYSIGTAYSYEEYCCSGHGSSVKLHNVLFLPFKKEIAFNNNVRLPKKLVNYFEALNLSDMNCPYFRSEDELFSELESLGVRPYQEYQKLVDDYCNQHVSTTIIKQRILGNKNNNTK